MLPVAPLVTAAAAAALCAAILPGGPYGREGAPFPFVWRDVALVCFVCALPAAGLLAVFIRRRVPAAVSAALGVVLLGSVIIGVRAAGGPASAPDPLTAAVLRGTLAFGAAGSLVLFLTALFRPPLRRDGRGSPVGVVALGALALAALFLLPATYIEARCRHDLGRLTDLLEQSRLGEARELLRGLVALQPSAELKGHPLPEVAAELERMVHELESRVAAPLSASATDEARLERARDLAILGRTSDAVGVLQTLRGSSPSAEACGLYGTIYETRGEWETARDWYGRAKQGWESLPPSPERTAGLRQATMGVGFCGRKLGRNREAEAAYLEVLALSPTAESHFLLAQFYEDTQQAALAHFHARQAMTLAPARYQEQGRKLIDKLVTLHFGCLGVSGAESSKLHTSFTTGRGTRP